MTQPRILTGNARVDAMEDATVVYEQRDALLERHRIGPQYVHTVADRIRDVNGVFDAVEDDQGRVVPVDSMRVAHELAEQFPLVGLGAMGLFRCIVLGQCARWQVVRGLAQAHDDNTDAARLLRGRPAHGHGQQSLKQVVAEVNRVYDVLEDDRGRRVKGRITSVRGLDEWSTLMVEWYMDSGKPRWKALMDTYADLQ
jgi:hypothetical protein